VTPREQWTATMLLDAWVETYGLGAEARARLAAKTVKFLWLGDVAETEVSNDLPPTSGEIGGTR
jgi:hypothetical protein